jgi:hypothetical protein
MVTTATFTRHTQIRQLRDATRAYGAKAVNASTRFTHITCLQCVTRVPKTCTSATSQEFVVALSLHRGQGSVSGVGNLRSIRRNLEWAIIASPLIRMTILRWHVMQGRLRARTGCCMDELHVARSQLAQGSSYCQGHHLRQRIRRGGTSTDPEAGGLPRPPRCCPAPFVTK